MARRLIVEIIGDDASLQAAARTSAAALEQVKLGAAQAAQSQVNAAAIVAGVSGISDEAIQAAAELDRVRLTEGDAAASAAAGAQIQGSLDGIGDKASSTAAKIGLIAAALGGIGVAGLLAGGALAWVPGFALGTAGQLLGLGRERVLLTALGVAGSIAGAAIGGLLLAMGALGTMAVGMGTDLAGTLQAANDIKNVSTAMDNLQTAIQQYGRGSLQAAQAQTALNQAIAGVQPVAQAAVISAAKTRLAFENMFEQLTGQAVKTAAQIEQQVMLVGEKYLPVIGQFAAENMKIIKANLQPLFAWLQNPTFTGPGQGGGLGIFTNLEQIFQKDLPTAIHAFSQGLELLFKVIDVAAQHLGGFMHAVDALFTRLNGPEFGKVAHAVNMLIGLFDDVMHLLVAVGRTIIDVFKPAVGVGRSIIEEITHLLDLTDKWLSASGTQDVLHNLFEAHLTELQAIFHVLEAAGPILSRVIGAMAQILTIGAKIGTVGFQALADVIKAITEIPFAGKILGWGAAVAVAVIAIAKLVTALEAISVRAIAMTVAESAWTVATGIATAATGLATAATTAFGVALDFALGPIGLIVAALAALGAAIYLVVTHWGQITAFFESVWNKIKQLFDAGVRWVEQHWHAAWATVESDAKSVWGAILSFLEGVWSSIVGVVERIGEGIVHGVLDPLAHLARDLWNTVKGAITWAADQAIPWLYQEGIKIGKALLDGIWNGIKSLPGDLWGGIKSLGGDIVGGFKSVLGIGSPSRVMAQQVGIPIAQGILQGILIGGQTIPTTITGTVRKALLAALATINSYRSQFDNAFATLYTGANRRVPGVISPGQTQAGQELAKLQAQQAAAQLQQQLQAAQQAVAQAQQQLAADLAAGAPAATIAADQQSVTTAEQQLAAAQLAIREAALQKLANQQANAETKQNKATKHNMDIALRALEDHLKKVGASHKQAQDAILKLLEDYGSKYEGVGSGFVDHFIKGLMNRIKNVSGAAEAIAKELAKYLPHSPAEKGPLSKPIGWSNYLLGGLTEAGTAATQALERALAAPAGTVAIAGAGGGVGGGLTLHAHFDFSNYAGDPRQLGDVIVTALSQYARRNGNTTLRATLGAG